MVRLKLVNVEEDAVDRATLVTVREKSFTSNAQSLQRAHLYNGLVVVVVASVGALHDIIFTAAAMAHYNRRQLERLQAMGKLPC